MSARAAERWRARGLAVFAGAMLAFLMLPVVVVVLASFTTTSYLTIPPKGLTRWHHICHTPSPSSEVRGHELEGKHEKLAG